jgi:hypothetical protein
MEVIAWDFLNNALQLGWTQAPVVVFQDAPEGTV